MVDDLDRRMTVAFAVNRMGPSDRTDQRAPSPVRAVYAALDQA